MKSSQGRGMARGYAAGRAHIRELNRRNAEKRSKPDVDTHYAMQGDASINHWEVRLGPFDFKSEAERALDTISNNQFLDSKCTMNGVKAAECDPEGVARLKTNPKV
jgi:hypothetical protein